jgi:excisionase family DNA binding protein
MGEASRAAIVAATNPDPIPEAAGPPAKLALSVSEAVRISGISRSMLYRYIADGVLPVRKAGSRSLILASDLKKFLLDLPLLPPTRPGAR